MFTSFLLLFTQPGVDTIYNMTCQRVTLDFQVVTLWVRLSPSQRRLYQAAYMIPFFLDVTAPWSAVLLATFLLWFSDKAIRDFVLADDCFNPRGLPYVRNITYYLYPGGVYGVLFVDDGFGHWYNTLLEASYASPVLHNCPEYDCVMATYPRDNPDLRAPEVIRRCWEVTRYASNILCL